MTFTALEVEEEYLRLFEEGYPRKLQERPVGPPRFLELLEAEKRGDRTEPVNSSAQGTST